MKVVLDTNVFVSALIKPDGTAGSVLKTILCLQDHVLLLSEDIVAELSATLFYPKIRKRIPFDDEQIEFWIASIRVVAHELKIKYKYPILVQEDPKDDRYLHAAIEGKAGCIVSGDKHLLNLNPFKGIPIIKPVEFASFPHERLQQKA